MNTLTITVPAPLVRAAMTAQAGRHEKRHYLQGIHLSPHGHIAGTDGTILFRGLDHGNLDQYAQLPPDGAIIAIEKRPPAGAETVEIAGIPLPDPDVSDVDRHAARFTATAHTANGNATVCGARLVSGKYPDVERIIPKLPRDRSATGLAVAPAVLSRAMACYSQGKKMTPVAMFPGGATDTLLIVPDDASATEWYRDSLVVVMPCRPAHPGIVDTPKLPETEKEPEHETAN